MLGDRLRSQRQLGGQGQRPFGTDQQASQIQFALLVVKQIDATLGEQVLTIAINAVWISALLHGLTALPGAKWYAARINAMGDCPETMAITPSAKPLVTREH